MRKFCGHHISIAPTVTSVSSAAAYGMMSVVYFLPKPMYVWMPHVGGKPGSEKCSRKFVYFQERAPEHVATS